MSYDNMLFKAYGYSIDESRPQGPREFSFVCKQGQEDQVVKVLTSMGMEPKVDRSGEQPVVSATVPEGTSKRAINKALRDAGVPGAYPKGMTKLQKALKDFDRKKKKRK